MSRPLGFVRFPVPSTGQEQTAWLYSDLRFRFDPPLTPHTAHYGPVLQRIAREDTGPEFGFYGSRQLEIAAKSLGGRWHRTAPIPEVDPNVVY